MLDASTRTESQQKGQVVQVLKKADERGVGGYSDTFFFGAPSTLYVDYFLATE